MFFSYILYFKSPIASTNRPGGSTFYLKTFLLKNFSLLFYSLVLQNIPTSIFMSKAALTRQMILQNSFGLIYKKGYQSTSIDDILSTTHVTKGAFFYHFKNKDEMGLAMIREVMYPGMKENLIWQLRDKKDARKAIYGMMEGLLYDTEFFDCRFGCPAVNLVDEMSPLNKDFNGALREMMQEWQQSIVACIENDEELRRNSPNTNGTQVAHFIMSGYAGVRNMGKIYGLESYKTYLKELKNYLDRL